MTGEGAAPLTPPARTPMLSHIFHIIHPQKQKRGVQPFCYWGEHSKGLSNQADFEHMISYCELIECSRPIRFFIVSLMYNNTFCVHKEINKHDNVIAWVCVFTHYRSIAAVKSCYCFITAAAIIVLGLLFSISCENSRELLLVKASLPNSWIFLVGIFFRLEVTRQPF